MSEVHYECRLDWQIVLTDLAMAEFLQAVEEDDDDTLNDNNTDVHSYGQTAFIGINANLAQARKSIKSRKLVNSLYNKIIDEAINNFKLTPPVYGNAAHKLVMQATAATREAANALALLGLNTDACDQLAKQGQYIYVIYDPDMTVEAKEE